MTIVGAAVYAATTGGYLSLPISTNRNAIIGFRPSIGVTTLDVPQASNYGLVQRFNFKTDGSTLNYTGTGLTSGTFVFYYGSPWGNSVTLNTLAGVVSTFTTGSPGAFTFPSGPITLTAIACI